MKIISIYSESSVSFHTLCIPIGYLAVDAKNKPSDLESALVIIGNAKDMSSMSNVFKKEFDYTTEIDKDVIVYTFEYRFSKLI